MEGFKLAISSNPAIGAAGPDGLPSAFIALTTQHSIVRFGVFDVRIRTQEGRRALGLKPFREACVHLRHFYQGRYKSFAIAKDESRFAAACSEALRSNVGQPFQARAS